MYGIISNYKKAEYDLCRICLQSNDELLNPLINICKCKGTLSGLHINCLKLWIMHKLKFKVTGNRNCYLFYINSFNCEICKEPFPSNLLFNLASVIHGNQTYSLLNISRSMKNEYILLEKVNRNEDNSFFMIMIIFEEGLASYTIVLNDLKKGRKNDANIKLNDTSISSLHCRISLINNKIILEDCGSKFGSLVLVHGKIQIEPETNVVLMVGRSLLNCTLVNLNRKSSHFLDYYNNKLKRKKLINHSIFFKSFKSFDQSTGYFRSFLKVLKDDHLCDELQYI